MSPSESLKKLNIELPNAPDPVGAYVAFRKTGKLIFISGQLPIAKDGKAIKKVVSSVACGGRFTVALVSRTEGVEGWVLDSEVNECMNKLCRGNRHGAPAKFNIITRKHHCRACGGIFCDNCSSKKVKLETRGYTKSVRVCDNCYKLSRRGLVQ